MPVTSSDVKSLDNSVTCHIIKYRFILYIYILQCSMREGQGVTWPSVQNLEENMYV